jgi:biopolymer transport protein ExbD
MSGSPTPAGRGRRRDVDADLNLTPYIDLLTCMVAFLLIAAVWTQLARLSVAQKGQGDADPAVIEDLPFLTVAVHGDGFNVIDAREQKAIPKSAGGYDFGALARELAALKAAHVDQTTIRIISDDAVVFEFLVQTMDAAMSAGFPDVSLLDSGAEPR